MTVKYTFSIDDMKNKILKGPQREEYVYIISTLVLILFTCTAYISLDYYFSRALLTLNIFPMATGIRRIFRYFQAIQQIKKIKDYSDFEIFISKNEWYTVNYIIRENILSAKYISFLICHYMDEKFVDSFNKESMRSEFKVIECEEEYFEVTLDDIVVHLYKNIQDKDMPWITEFNADYFSK